MAPACRLCLRFSLSSGATERWPSGRRRSPAKGVEVKSFSWVRIPSSPPSCFDLRATQDKPHPFVRSRMADRMPSEALAKEGRFVWYVYLLESEASEGERYIGIT